MKRWPLAQYKFREWLEAQPKRKKFRPNNRDCPLAKALRALGYLDPKVPLNFGCYFVPKWVDKFIAVFDESSTFTTLSALKALDQIEDERRGRNRKKTS